MTPPGTDAEIVYSVAVIANFAKETIPWLGQHPCSRKLYCVHQQDRHQHNRKSHKYVHDG